MLQKFDKKKIFHVIYNMSCKMLNVENMLHSYELEILTIANVSCYDLGLRLK